MCARTSSGSYFAGGRCAFKVARVTLIARVATITAGRNPQYGRRSIAVMPQRAELLWSAQVGSADLRLCACSISKAIARNAQRRAMHSGGRNGRTVGYPGLHAHLPSPKRPSLQWPFLPQWTSHGLQSGPQWLTCHGMHGRYCRRRLARAPQRMASEACAARYPRFPDHRASQLHSIPHDTVTLRGTASLDTGHSLQSELSRVLS